MQIVNEEDVNLKLVSEATETQSPKSEITIERTEIKLVVNGVDLESCIKYKGYYLIFTTDDCPFEESLNIYLLSNENKILDSATLVWPYGAGSFRLLRVADPNLVKFKFFGEKDWQVEIFDTKRLFIPYVSEPSGVWRKIKFKRHFGISEITPQKSTATI